MYYSFFLFIDNETYAGEVERKGETMLDEGWFVVIYLMKFGKNLRGDAVPEWRECYLDYGHLKIFILLIKRIVELNEAADHLVTLTGSENNDETSAVIIHSETIIDSTTQRLQSIKVELL